MSANELMEKVKALPARERRQILTRAQENAVWMNIEQDLRVGRLFPMTVNWVPVWRMAARWAASHTAAIGSRSLDILHVALARKLAAAEFLSFDTRQRTLAQ